MPAWTVGRELSLGRCITVSSGRNMFDILVAEYWNRPGDDWLVCRGMD